MSVSRTSPASVHTAAWIAFEQNLDTISHMLVLTRREFLKMQSALKRSNKAAARALGATKATKDSPETRLSGAKRGMKHLTRSINASLNVVDEGLDRVKTMHLWQVVMLVTCVEAYLQDVFAAAAAADGELMSKSEQMATYPEILAAGSLKELASELRMRWARGWVSDGGPTRWIERLEKMGARGFPPDLAGRLERVWGLRHVIVHAAGFATPDFVRRHPGVVKAPGERIPVSSNDLKAFYAAMKQFMEPTEAYFLARFPSLSMRH
jgi:hypothetical protein